MWMVMKIGMQDEDEDAASDGKNGEGYAIVCK